MPYRMLTWEAAFQNPYVVVTFLFAIMLVQPQPPAAEEENDVEVPDAPTPPSTSNAPSPPLQDPITTPPQAQPAPSPPPQDNQLTPLNLL
nr:hypothetical protein [Tanacetum cinerariifolium]